MSDYQYKLTTENVIVKLEGVDLLAPYARAAQNALDQINEFTTGPAGPSNNTRINLAAFKAAATTDKTSLYDGSLWTWETANAPYTADDVNVVKADSTALSVGAWVRQGAGGIVAADGAAGSLWTTVAGFISYLRSSAGAAIVGFLQAGTGAVARNLQVELRDLPITPQQFGAVADGVVDPDTGVFTGTDCTAAVQAAINAARTTGKSLFIPAGGYVLSDTITSTFLVGSTFRSLNIRGEGQQSVFIWNGGNNKPMIKLNGTGGAGWKSKNCFENFRLFGRSRSGGTYTGVVGIQLGDTPEDGFSGIVNPVFRGVSFQDCAIGIHAFYESDQVLVDDCYFEKYAQYGIRNQHGGSNWTVFHSHFYEGAVASIGFRTSLTSTRFIANTVQGTEFSKAVQVDGGPTNLGQSFYATANYIECGLDHDYAFELNGVWGGLIEGNIFKGCRGSTLIYIGSSGGLESRNIQIGNNLHTVSGGNLNHFAYCDATAVGCTITGQLESRAVGGTPGAYTTAKIAGPFVSIVQDGTLDLTGALKVDGTQVISNRGAAVADATDAASAITQLNALLARARAHGLIAP